MVRAPGPRSPSRGTTHPRATAMEEVPGGWLVPPFQDRLPAAQPIGRLPAMEEVPGGWFVPPVHDRLPAAQPIRGLPFGWSHNVTRATDLAANR
jgi:hypothetical protein